jgi:hypothetical protein
MAKGKPADRQRREPGPRAYGMHDSRSLFREPVVTGFLMLRPRRSMPLIGPH